MLFFFKQKTAYEMRISDWSSDVCSSDLPVSHRHVPRDARARCWQLATNSALNSALCVRRLRRPPTSAYSVEYILSTHILGRRPGKRPQLEIGRASCRERVCQYV